MKLQLENWYLGYSQILADCRDGGSALLLCHADVDAMAAARILSYMLRQDGVAHQLLPCRSHSQLQSRVAVHRGNASLRAVVLLNVGAMRNLTRLFRSSLDPAVTKVYLMDCRRPVHLANVHAESSVVVFWDGVQKEDDIPSDGDNLSGNESSSSSGSGSSDGEEDSDDDASDADDGENEFEGDEDQGEVEFGGDSDKRPPEDPMLDVGQEQDTDYDGDVEREKRTRSKKKLNDPPNNNVDDDDDDASMSPAEPTERTAATEPTLTDTTARTSSSQDNNLPTLTPRELHDDRRNRLRQYYSDGSYYGTPAAFTAYTIARQNRFQDVGDLLWLACVGVTDAYVHARLDVAGYSALALQLRGLCHALFPNDDFSRVSHTTYSEHLTAGGGIGNNGTNNASTSSSTLTRISFSGNGRILTENDFRFFLLRHTSLFDAMVHSDYISTRFQLSTVKGMHKLQEMLAKMGLPLEQCHQPFAYMNPMLRRQLQDKLREYAEEYGLVNFEFTSFFRITGYQSLLSASDTSYAVTALLECETADTVALKNDHAGEDERLMQAFNVAYDALNSNQAPTVSLNGLSGEGNSLASLVNGGKLTGNNGLAAGIRLAMGLQKNIMATAKSLVERHVFSRLTHFRLAYITCTSHGENGIAGDENMTGGGKNDDVDHVFAKPLALTRLAHYLMDMHRENGKWTGNNARPLILLAEKPSSKSFVVVGYEYPESSGDLVKNRFGKNFELAAQSMRGTFVFDSFDSNVVEVARGDAQRFMEQLHYLMDSL